jgi:uncharacterized protein (DUF58 family)
MIPQNLLRELQYLEISTTRAIRTSRPGSYTSRSRGSGFDFDQHLPYRRGDDVRRIDWNVTARLGSPYLRQTHAERDLDVIMAVDLSRSMHLGSARSKKEVMMIVTGALLFSAAGDQINTGFLGFSDEVLTWSPPRRATGRTWHILETLWATDPRGATTRVRPALRHIATAVRTTSVVVLVSDFFTDDDPFGSSDLRTLAAVHDVIVAVVEHPQDVELPQGYGTLRVADAETGRVTVVALNERNRRAFAAAAARRRKEITDACFRLGLEAIFVRSDRPVMQPLIDLFWRRRKH